MLKLEYRQKSVGLTKTSCLDRWGPFGVFLGESGFCGPKPPPVRLKGARVEGKTLYSEFGASADNLRLVKRDLVLGEGECGGGVEGVGGTGLSKVCSQTLAGKNPSAGAPTAAGAGASMAPGLNISSQRAPSGKCLFSLLSLGNSNTVNFISEWRSRWIL